MLRRRVRWRRDDSQGSFADPIATRGVFFYKGAATLEKREDWVEYCRELLAIQVVRELAVRLGELPNEELFRKRGLYRAGACSGRNRG